MPPDETYQKRSSYGPAARLPNSPAKGYTNKLKIGGSDDSGRCSSLKQGRAYKNYSTETVQKLRDTES